ncbi:MAG: VOC family protein [Acidimicrobiales bacterium]
MPQRAFYSILSSDVARSRDWYVALFGYRVEFDSDWFVNLQDQANPSLELGLMARDNEIVNERLRATPTGGLVTLVVDDVDAIHEAARSRNIEILEPPTNLFYGQRRMLIADPDGQILDVSSECPADPEWLAQLGSS